MPRVILTCDLGYGDSGKGTVVDSLVRRHDIPIVIRYSGGAQCGHNVITDEGIHHTFAQFGSGSLAGAKTILNKDVIVDPLRLLNEGNILLKKLGHIPPDIFVHEDCLVITPFHKLLNRAKEELRGDNRHGSCGIGLGETVAHSLKYPDHALRVKDLKEINRLKDKLIQIRNDILKELDDIDFHEVNLYILSIEFQMFYQTVKIVNSDSISKLIKDKDIIFEAAQGVLLDQDYGFHPYTTWSRVTLKNAIDFCKQYDINDYSTLGILRTYSTRHGPGPFPTENNSILNLIKENHNVTNDWQRHFRVGLFDLKMARYALKVAGRIDSLAFTHTDVLSRIGTKIAEDYDIDLDIIDPNDFPKRENFTKQLMESRNIKYKDLKAEWFERSICSELNNKLAMISSGPKYKNKIFFNI